jgi:predicted pyridoxine 5'-phosphate oxidase superfamily flavin-nucleotide-binding protein
LDTQTLAYADFRGNVQYLSVGNIAAEERVALILMDYARRQRLKIWARAAVVDLGGEPDLARRLAEPGYPARIERAVVMSVAALDWNCPQHITPRFTAAEIDQGVAGASRRQAAPGASGSCDAASDLRAPGGLDLLSDRSSHNT